MLITILIIYLIFLILKFNYSHNVATNITLLRSVGFLLFIACYKYSAATLRATLQSLIISPKDGVVISSLPKFTG